MSQARESSNRETVSSLTTFRNDSNLRLARPVTSSKQNKKKDEEKKDDDSTPLFEDPVNYSLLHRTGKKMNRLSRKIEAILFEYVARDLTEATPTQLSEAFTFAEEKDHELNWFDTSDSIVRLLRGSTTNKNHWHHCAAGTTESNTRQKSITSMSLPIRQVP